jgi:membrane protein implicated in regulation of membrane protease activity
MRREMDTAAWDVLAMFLVGLATSAVVIAVWLLAGWSKELLGTALILATTPLMLLVHAHNEKPRGAAERRKRG